MVTKGTKVMVLATARSSGGIHHLSLQLLVAGQKGYGVLTVANPDAHGRLPDALYILGTDGHDHVGSIPLIFTMDGSPASAEATSSSYSGTSTTVKLTFSCADCR
jgi:hypothetical protein